MTIFNCPNCMEPLAISSKIKIKFPCKKCKTPLVAFNGTLLRARDARSNQSYTTNSGYSNAKADNFTFNIFDYLSIFISKIYSWRSLIRPIWVVSFLALIICFFGIKHYINSQKDRWAFEKLQSSAELHEANNFLSIYPNSDYYGKVLILRDSLVFIDSKKQFAESCRNSVCNCQKLQDLYSSIHYFNSQKIKDAYEDCLFQKSEQYPNFDNINDYFNQFPEGKHSAKLSELKNKIWDKLDNDYSERGLHTKASKGALLYVNDLLKYGRKNQINKIHISFESELSLMDWDDYPQETHDLLDKDFEISNKETNSDDPLPSSSPPPSIKSSLKYYKSNLENIAIQALQGRLDSLLTPNPFTVKRVNTLEKNSVPTIHISYSIQTLKEESIDIPILYRLFRQSYFSSFPNNFDNKLGNYRDLLKSLSEEDKRKLISSRPELAKLLEESELLDYRSQKEEQFVGYLLATQINWSVYFQVPDSDNNFEFETISRPKSQYSNVKGNHDAYQRMLSSSFENFGEKVAIGIGL